jgi:glycosyltransferase involved in cell wall biosynthesis
LTGSGVTLDATVRHASAAGWEQRAVVGIPADGPAVTVGDLPPDRIHTLPFAEPGAAADAAGAGTGLDFPVPGMSDVMPYRSTVFSRMSTTQLARYRAAWRALLDRVLTVWRPDVIHAHHVWLLGAMIKDSAPTTPVVNQCHATGLRQMELCPHLAAEVQDGCRRNDRFLVTHAGYADQLIKALRITRERVTVVGAGYDKQVFRPASSRHEVGDRLAKRDLVYVGKLSEAKGLTPLLDAAATLAEPRRHLTLHVAGAGAGPEAARLRRRLESMRPLVQYHGQLGHRSLAQLLRRCHTCVLPSYYEGLPLVLVEAVACGCRIVATDLPGVRDVLAPHLGPALVAVPLPRLKGIDTPDPRDLPAFTARLAAAIAASLDRPALAETGFDQETALAPLTWAAVFARIERIWRELVD